MIAGGYRVDDANGQALAYVCGRDVHVAHQAKGLTQDEAHHIAAVIAKLPELMASRTSAGVVTNEPAGECAGAGAMWLG